jgi:hypothetical protein
MAESRGYQPFISAMEKKYGKFTKPQKANPTADLSAAQNGQPVPRKPSRFTGRGLDNQAQPEKPAGVTHEDEYVVSSPDVQKNGGPQGIEDKLQLRGGNAGPPSDMPRMGGQAPMQVAPELPPLPAPVDESTKMPGFRMGGYVPGYAEGGFVETMSNARKRVEDAKAKQLAEKEEAPSGNSTPPNSSAFTPLVKESINKIAHKQTNTFLFFIRPPFSFLKNYNIIHGYFIGLKTQPLEHGLA